MHTRTDGELQVGSGHILMISCFYVLLDVVLDYLLKINPGALLSSVFVCNVIRLIESTQACGSKWISFYPQLKGLHVVGRSSTCIHCVPSAIFLVICISRCTNEAAD